MPPPLKLNDVVKRISRNSLYNTNIVVTGRVVEICQNTLFLNILWDNTTVPSLEQRRNLRREYGAESIIPQTTRERVATYRAVNAQEPIIPQTPQARLTACRARKKTLDNSIAPINKDAKNYKVFYIYVWFICLFIIEFLFLIQ